RERGIAGVRQRDSLRRTRSFDVLITKVEAGGTERRDSRCSGSAKGHGVGRAGGRIGDTERGTACSCRAGCEGERETATAAGSQTAAAGVGAQPTIGTVFPYTTLFRSRERGIAGVRQRDSLRRTRGSDVLITKVEA